MELSEEQGNTVSKVRSAKGGFHFITGKAGTGKSTIVNELKKDKRTVVLAPTGIAALNVRGQTIHSFFKMPIKPFAPNEGDGIDRYYFNGFDTMIIDEISMVRVDVMQYISNSLRNSSDSGEIFGGKKVVVVGDLSQLPPVVAGVEDNNTMKHFYDGVFFFYAPIFKEVEINIYKLTKVFRQNKSTFLDIVNQARYGLIKMDSINYLNTKVKKAGGDVTRLCTTNKSVNQINYFFLGKLKTKSFIFKASYSPNFTREKPAPEMLEIKVGAKVMFLINAMGCVNGEILEIFDILKSKIGLKKESGDKIYVERYTWREKQYTVEDGRLVLSDKSRYTQFPIKLAYAITIHKSQGITLNKAHIDFGRGCFTHGQFYVALSRLKSDTDLTFERGVQKSDLIYDESVNNIKDKNYKLVSI